VRQIAIFACYVIAAACLGVLVAIGYLLAKLYREVPPGEECWNCWAFAAPRFLQDSVKTGLLVSSSVHVKAVPHVRFVPIVEGVACEEAVPVEPKKGWRAVFDLVKHKSEIKRRVVKDA
jgi:hypothetical protein